MSNETKTSIDWLFLMLNNPNRNQEFSQKLYKKAKELETQQAVQFARLLFSFDNHIKEENDFVLAQLFEMSTKVKTDEELSIIDAENLKADLNSRNLEKQIFIDDVEMSPRLKNSLKKIGIRTINEAKRFPGSKLIQFRGLGKKCQLELQMILSNY